MQYTIPRNRDGSLSTTNVMLTEDDGSIRFITIGALTKGAQDYAAWLAAGNQPAQATVVTRPPPVLTFLQFMALFTSAEQTAIINSSDAQTKMFVIMAAGSGGLQLANAQIIAGVNYLATATTASPPGPGLITSARAAQILAGEAPASTEARARRAPRSSK